MPESIAVLGAGSWGTALAIQCARSGRETHLWGRDATQLAAMAAQRENRRYLPGAAFPAALSIAGNLAAAVDAVRDILIAVPSHAFRDSLVMVRPLLRILRPRMVTGTAASGSNTSANSANFQCM